MEKVGQRGRWGTHGLATLENWMISRRRRSTRRVMVGVMARREQGVLSMEERELGHGGRWLKDEECDCLQQGRIDSGEAERDDMVAGAGKMRAV